MKLAKTFLFALPLLVALTNSASAALVFNLQLVGSSLLDTTSGPANRTVNLRAVDTAAPNDGVFFFNGTPTVSAAPNIVFSAFVPEPAPLAASTTLPGNIVGSFTLTVAQNVSFALTNVQLNVNYTNYAFSPASGSVSPSVGITAVPEPGTFGVLAMGGLVLLRRRRR